MRKSIYHIFLVSLAWAVFAVSCSKAVPETAIAGGTVPGTGTLSGGTGSVVLRISSLPATRSNDDINSLTGSKFENLRVWLVADDNTIVKYWHGEYAPGAEKTEELVELDEVARSTYALYIVGNYTGLDTYTEGSLVNAAFYDEILNVGAYTGAVAMPLSYRGSINVYPGENTISVKMLRTFARYSLRFYNHTHTKNIIVTSAKISDFKPDRAYLFNHDYNPPAGTSYQAMDAIPMTTVPPSTAITVLDQFIFEGSAPSYQFAIAGGVFGQGVTSATGDLSFGTAGTTRNTTSSFLIVNNGYYMGIVGGSLRAISMTDEELYARDDMNNFLWKFTSAYGGGTLRNVGTSQYIRPRTTGNIALSNYQSTSFTQIDVSGNYLRFRYYSYYMGRNTDGTVNMLNGGATNQNRQWQTREFSEIIGNGGVVPDKTFRKVVPLNYIDHYGAMRMLNATKRNEHIGTTVNMYYNADTGTFYYEVEEWTPVMGEITFN